MLKFLPALMLVVVILSALLWAGTKADPPLPPVKKIEWLTKDDRNQFSMTFGVVLLFCLGLAVLLGMLVLLIQFVKFAWYL
jgi:hypothetical protein